MSVAEIARIAKVPYGMAWRILNNRPCASREAVNAVRQALRNTGYTPPAGRRRGRPSKMVDGIRTRSIALLELRPATTLSSTILCAVQRRLAEKDLNLIFAHVEKAAELPPAVRDGNVDGILGYGQFPENGVFSDGIVSPRIEQIPAVWMMTRQDRGYDKFGDRVRPDHQAMGHMVARRLLDGGHRHIALIQPDSTSQVMIQRRDSFIAEAEGCGARVDLYMGERSNDPLDEAGRLMSRWLETVPRSTAIFTLEDSYTVTIHRLLMAAGIEIRHDARGVELISTDNNSSTALADLQPTPISLDLNREMIADLAVERLFWRMKHGISAPQVVINVKPKFPGRGAGERPLASMPGDAHQGLTTG